MNAIAFRRIRAIAGAAAVTTAITITGSTAPATAGQIDTTKDRPCFMIRSPWNNAEGPQPTCPNGRFSKAASDEASTSPSASSRRITDFMP